jgi:hypothetical protein
LFLWKFWAGEAIFLFASSLACATRLTVISHGNRWRGEGDVRGRCWRAYALAAEKCLACAKVSRPPARACFWCCPSNPLIYLGQDVFNSVSHGSCYMPYRLVMQGRDSKMGDLVLADFVPLFICRSWLHPTVSWHTIPIGLFYSTFYHTWKGRGMIWAYGQD